MEYILAIIILGFCVSGMAIGLIMKNRALRRGCSIDPTECECLREGKITCSEEEKTLKRATRTP
ncbi:hypothetical protein IID04_07470 [PVC group bacterium]|nr:hypothetical protein [PVC group bacterium]